MRIGILGAMPEEVALLRADLSGASEARLGGRRYLRGRLYGADAVLTFSRMGKVASAATAATLIARFRADLVVFTGVAGAASRSLRIGDVVVADRLVQHDLDARPLYPRFEAPLLGVSRFPAAARLRALARRAAAEFLARDLREQVPPATLRAFHIRRPRAVTGLIASGDQFIAGPGRLRAIARSLPGLQCVEMEGAAVAQVCHEHRVPCAVIRTISDRADHSAAIDFSRFVASVASPYSRGILRRLLPRLAANG
jgi:adenosylhomocysteine nucleosidase